MSKFGTKLNIKLTKKNVEMTLANIRKQNEVLKDIWMIVRKFQ